MHPEKSRRIRKNIATQLTLVLKLKINQPFGVEQWGSSSQNVYCLLQGLDSGKEKEIKQQSATEMVI
ncbi:hypothetical protein KAM347_39740 [Aeromonas caviae]|uniref:Uncharacterized protein n=1 Tax=Aeromonas caviae TaxID=648 RepID=A0AAV4YI66_AERCA|nr:hypothetical protein KAM334_17880 [Aeromonas caviae]GJA32153.1 hypothetical protein KAM341_18310 [Aeromonas caviae]GJA36010.1 hypothetical protein KAM342_12530 [Aeromonas caviae]GJA39836.1 hypothetical protein KAM343_06320 [Aeromonas caviae]GJA52183.1 hypothetical protein KAM347_39740 [Aeromonas caviae]